jgi:predicted RNA-binding protein with RPS1 domain
MSDTSPAAWRGCPSVCGWSRSGGALQCYKLSRFVTRCVTARGIVKDRSFVHMPCCRGSRRAVPWWQDAGQVVPARRALRDPSSSPAHLSGLPVREELIALQGQIVKGKVVRLEEYGAFVEVTTEDGGAVTGLVHVSEVDADFVENIYAYLAEGDEVDVKILDVKEDGKVDLSIKRADPDWQDEETPNLRSKLDKDFNKRLRRFMHKSQMIQGEARRQRAVASPARQLRPGRRRATGGPDRTRHRVVPAGTSRPRPVRGRAPLCLGLPTVVRVDPRLPDGTPFPTVFWQTCPALRSQIGRLEADQSMVGINQRLDTEPDFQQAHAEAQERYRRFRDDLDGPLPGDPYAGGNPRYVKCLHVHAGHELATGDSPVGSWTIEAARPVPCSGPCVDDAEVAAWSERLRAEGIGPDADRLDLDHRDADQ